MDFAIIVLSLITVSFCILLLTRLWCVILDFSLKYERNSWLGLPLGMASLALLLPLFAVCVVGPFMLWGCLLGGACK